MSNISSPLFRGAEISVPGLTQTLVASSAIAPVQKIIPITSASAIALTSTPAIIAGQSGQEITLFNAGNYSITIPGSGVTFLGGNTSLVLAVGTIASFVFLGGSWRQVSPRPTVAPTAKIFNSTNITLQNTTNTTLPFDSTAYDSHGFHSSANNSQLICQVEGVYSFTICLSFAPNVTGYRGGYLYKNATVISCNFVAANASANSVTVLAFPGTDYLKVGDAITVVGRQTSGMALDIVASNSYSPYMGMIYGGQSTP